ncbi:MAG: ABC transporter substrate-binding protein [Desulfocapsaceae bacterium]|jgi:phospholipid transport system substrate-binding protein|nr:ABC transporter substrate-binding protein [Desulfocapsaceae bacterium]
MKAIQILMYAGIILLVGSWSQGTELSGPTEQLKPALDSLIVILEDDSLKGAEKKKERRSLIMKEISNGFDFREMSQRVLGRTWNTITPEEQDYFVTQMTKLLENVYVGKLESYTGQAIEFVEERIKGNRAQVTTLIENEGVKLPVHYIMQKTGSKWMVYDINIEGVSLIRNYMEQFRSILRQNDFNGLVKILEEKNLSFAQNDGA